MAEAAASCAPPLADASVGARHLSRRMARMMTPSANASGVCSQTADTDTGDLAGAPLWLEATAGHTLRKVVFPAALLPERPTQEQRRPKNSTIRVGKCNRSEACRSWCICRWWYACNRCSGSSRNQVSPGLKVGLEPVNACWNYLSLSAVAAGNRCPLPRRGLLLRRR